MLATEQEIEALEQLQRIDTEAIRNKKKLEGLPQRQVILEARQKLAQVVKKKTQVQDMIDEAEDNLGSLLVEDERLAQKQAETQEALDRVKGDYRSVESYSKDLHGVQKRREKLAEEMERLDQQIERIRPLMDQIMPACTELEGREQSAIASFQEEGGALQQALAQADAEREALRQAIAPELYRAYNRACNECGGIGVAELVDSSCSACRTAFDQSRLSKIKQDEPVSRCPSCRRLLIIKA